MGFELLIEQTGLVRSRPQTTLADFGLGPNLFVPGVPSWTWKTSKTIHPISGTSEMSTHQPVRWISWSLLIDMAMLGIKIARLKMVLNRPAPDERS